MNAFPPGNHVLHEAHALHRAGRLRDAVAAYHAVIKREPNNARAYHLCAMAEAQSGHHEAAVRTIAKALKRAPDDKDIHNAAGNIYAERQMIPRALAHFRKALSLDPEFADALFNLGNALAASGEPGEGAKALKKAASLRPGWVEARIALGNALALDGRPEAALAAFDAAAELAPRLFIAHFNRGNALKRLGRHEDAIAAYRTVLGLRPDFAEAGNNIGTSLAALGRHDEAVAAFEETLRAAPGYARALYNLGKSELALGRRAEGIANYRKAVAADPAMAEAVYNLARALVEDGEVEEGIARYREALRLDPEDADTALNLGLELLGRGEFPEGWALYEARLREAGHVNRFGAITANFDPRRLPVPSPGPGEGTGEGTEEPLMIIGEQGLGDEIMFASLIPDAIARNVRPVLVADRRLKGLFARSFPGTDVHAHDELPALAERMAPERRCFIGSLAGALRGQPGDFPGTPYLVPDPARVSAFRARLDALGPERKVGVMWRGGVGSMREQRRSLALADLLPLMARPAQFVSLSHLAAAREETETLFRETGQRVHHWPEVTESEGYDDTAALLAALDTVISVTCTAAHCAGALGADTHVLVPERAEWRYGQVGSSIPWYKSMTLYRRKRDWPLEDIARAVWGTP